MKQQIKSRKRVVDHGEVYTPEWIVKDMLDLVKDETNKIGSRFLEPACGNGNFLCEIFERKMKAVNKKSQNDRHEFEKNMIIATGSIYGIDILKDNLEEAQTRLFEIFKFHYWKAFKDENKMLFDFIWKILGINLIHADALSVKKIDRDKDVIFSEWNFVGDLITQKDFRYRDLIDKSVMKSNNSKKSSILSYDTSFADPVSINTKEYKLKSFLY